MYQRIITSLLGLALFSSASVLAQDTERGPRPDRRDDQRVERRAEKQKKGAADQKSAQLEQIFERFDKDGNGQLDRSEVATFTEAVRRRVAAGRDQTPPARKQRAERRTDRQPPKRARAKAEGKRQRGEARTGKRAQVEGRRRAAARARAQRGAARAPERTRRPQAQQGLRGQRRVDQARRPMRRGALQRGLQQRDFQGRGRDQAQPNRRPQAQQRGQQAQKRAKVPTPDQLRRRLDRNGNGKLDPEERERARQLLKQRARGV